jgi:uncharacterized membrane protein YfcA
MLGALLLAIVAFSVSILTLFAGFGLGTLLLPAFALFLPPAVAVASTAIVHFANNIFKVTLLARHARGQVVTRFGLPAIAAAIAGAYVLSVLPADTTIASWDAAGRRFSITPVKLVLGVLIVAFGLLELLPGMRHFRASPRHLPIGGVIAGFFGGLSGHQGALRAAFLAPLGLSPTEFAATQSVLGLMVDAARLLVYTATFLTGADDHAVASGIPWRLVAVAAAAALTGAWVGRTLLPKMTIARLHLLVGVLLLLVGTALALGVI